MKRTLWALFDDRAGSVGQAKGILPLLNDDFEVEIKTIAYNRLAALPNCLLGASLLGVDRRNSSLTEPPYPDLVLSISRRTAPIARYIRNCPAFESPSGTVSFHEGDPLFDYYVAEFDGEKFVYSETYN